MHPNSTFAWADDAAMRAFAATQSFAQISIAVDGVPMCAHAPMSVAGDGSFRFHLARANPLVALLDGRSVLATVVGEHGYISPDWYGTDDQVPTWDYRLVEIRGPARRLDDTELRAQVDALSATQEARLVPKLPWTSEKMTPGRLEAMLRAIVGFSIETPVLHGCAKLGQNKGATERAGAIAGLRGSGDHSLADAMVRA
jgi:transcriptional regulator